MNNLIIFGSPGAGKGTQSEKIAKSLNLKPLSTGHLLRKEVASNSELGKEIGRIIKTGSLVPDYIVDNIIKTEIAQNGTKSNFIFDGYPRTLSQSVLLDSLFSEKQRPILIHLQVSEKEVINRLRIRKEQLDRIDDNEEVIKDRLEIYKKTTKPLLDYYQSGNRLIEVNGEGEIEDIFLRIIEELKNF